MLYTKLLLRRLACVPWLLASGLVLGWSGKAAAQDATISLTADPTVISEDAGATNVVVTATLDGKMFDEDVVLLLIFDNESTARRDVDYSAALSPLTIPAGSVSGTTTLTIIPYNDKRVGADKTIRLKAYNDQITAKDDEGNDVKVTVGTVDIALKDAGASSVLSFAADAAIYDRTYIVGREVADWLPEAFGGTGNLTYSVLALPAELSFDASTRTLSGTPTAATDGAVAITYRVTDESGVTITRTFAITIVIIVEDATVSLTVNPSVISEDAGATDVVVTATLDGKAFDEDVVVFLSIDSDENIDKAAVRDLDYDARLSLLMIPAGSVSGTTTITITPYNDKRAEGDETIRLKGAYAKTVGNRDITLKDAGTGSTIVEAVAEEPEEPEESEEPEELEELEEPEEPKEPEDSSLASDDDPVIDDRTGEKPTPTVELDGISSSHDSVREDDDEATIITLTVTLDRVAAADEKVALAIVSPTQGKTAKLDEDFDATLDETLTIAKGQIKGTAQLSLTPKDNTTVDGDKAFGVQATSSSGHRALINIKIADNEMDDGDGEDDGEDDGEVDDGEDGGEDDGEVDDGEDDGELDASEDDSEDDGEMAFGFAEEVADQAYTAGAAITPLVLPEASGGTGALTYRIVGLPAGLSFDAATRTLSGTPSAATDGAVEVTYIVTDEGGARAFLIFSITVNPPLSFGDFFNFG